MDSIVRVPDPPPYRPIAFAPVDVACDAVRGGGFRLHARTTLEPHDQSLGRMFRAAVEAQPDRAFLAERSGDRWRTLTYAASRPIVDAIAAAFIERGLSAERPVMVLSGNSIDHALLMLPPIRPAFRLRPSRSPIRSRAAITPSSGTLLHRLRLASSMWPIPPRSPARSAPSIALASRSSPAITARSLRA